jgi:hypothetical protein
MLAAALVKEVSSAPVYLLYAGRLFWILTPADFADMGFDWSKVQTMPDGSLANIPMLPFKYLGPNGIAVPLPSDPGNFDLSVDTPWNTPGDSVLAFNCKDPLARVAQHILVAGWLDGLTQNVLTGVGIEDWYADLILDIDFLLALYGPGGLSTALLGKSFPGNTDRLASLGSPLPISYASDAAGRSGIDINSLILPGNSKGFRTWALPQPYIHIELNCWHSIGHPAPGKDSPPWAGRPIPMGWMQKSFGNDTDGYWTFSPTNPDHGPRDLQEGDFVIVRGTLWQDFCHGYQTVFNTGPMAAQSGWSEIHPIDWIQRVPPPPMPSMAAVIQLGDQPSVDSTLIPDVTRLATQFPTILDVQEYVDTRLSDQTASRHVVNKCDQVAVDAALITSGGRFKSIVNVRSEAAPCSAVGAGANLSLFKCGTGRGILLNQLNPATGSWATWGPVLTGSIGFLPTDFATTSGSAVALLQSSLYLFAPGRGADPAQPLAPVVEALFYKNWNLAASPDPTAPWERFDGIFTSSPSVCTWGSVMHLFIRGENNDILYNHLDLSVSASWQGWQSLGGVATSAPSCAVVGGAMYVFVKGLDDLLYFTGWQLPTPPGSPMEWIGMGGRFSSSPSLLADGPVLHLFVRGQDLDVLYNRLDTSTGSAWTGFQSLGGLATSSPASALVSWIRVTPPHGIALVESKYVFVVGEGDKIYFKSWATQKGIGPSGPDPGGPWSQVPDS